MLLRLTAALVLGVGLTSPARAAVISYQSEIHTGNNRLAFYNMPAATLKITGIDVYLGANAVFDLDGSNGDQLPAGLFPLASTSSTNTIPVSHFTPVWAANKTDAEVGLINTLASYFTDEAQLVQFRFNDFNPGEAWGVFVDIDIKNNGGAVAASRNMTGALVTVYYEGGWQLTSACPGVTGGVCFTYTGSGGGRSHPSYQFGTVADTPEPASFTLIGAGLAGFLVLRRKSARPAPSL